jgi:hypothetical protein
MRVKELRDLDLPLQGELNSTNKHNNYGSLSVLGRKKITAAFFSQIDY